MGGISRKDVDDGDFRDRYYAYYATFLAILVLFIITLGIWIIPGHRPRWIWLLLAFEIAALAIGGFTIRQSIYANFLDLVSRYLRRAAHAPGFGFVGRRLSDADVREAFPPGFPQGEPRGEPSDSPRPEFDDGELARQAAWTERLRAANSVRQPGEQAPVPFTTTIGLVRFRRRGVKLAVVEYFQPNHMFRAWRTSDPDITVAGAVFPIVIRPWLPVHHRGKSGIDGHCWVTFGENSDRYGVVTALHVVRPKESKIGADVTIDTARSVITGKLRQPSITMDAALIEVERDNVPELTSVRCTEVIGFKPVRIVTGSPDDHSFLRGYITGHPGFHNGIYVRQPGSEPIIRAFMTFNAQASHGDSGCLVFDTEGEDRGYTAPYLIYQGVINMGRGVEGFGLFLGQVIAQWSVNIHTNSSAVIPSLALERRPNRMEITE